MSNAVTSPHVLSPNIDSPASSVRPSLDIPVRNNAGNVDVRRASPSPNPATSRRNRAALRDYYNLSGAGALNRNVPSRTASIASNTSTVTNATNTAQATQVEALPLIDAPDFSPEAYVTSLMSTSSLSSILRAESTLVSEIKNLDGERKALVYDNYSKLIHATETIAQLQKGMDDQAGGGGLKMMGTLGPAVEKVAATAREIQGMRQNKPRSRTTNRDEVQTVKWIKAAPQRFAEMIDNGQGEEVREQWTEVAEVLDAWKLVKGAAEVKKACEQVLKRLEEPPISEDG